MSNTFKCVITGQEVPYVTKANYYEYQVSVNRIGYRLRVAKDFEWTQVESPGETKLILHCMLYNSEWQVDGDAIIGPDLIKAIVNFSVYPRGFNAKADYFLKKVFGRNAEEFERIDYSGYHPMAFYAVNKDEVDRLIRKANSDGNITIADNALTFTSKGITKAKQLLNIDKNLIPQSFIDGDSPSVVLIYTKGDEKHFESAFNFILKYGITVSSIGPLSEDDDGDIIDSHRNVLRTRSNNYFLFIKSTNSDRSHSFGSLVDIAIEIHNSPGYLHRNLLFFAGVDGSSKVTRPRIDKYYSTFFDFRIFAQRNQFIKHLSQDWTRIRRGESKPHAFKFPRIHLNDYEKAWLEAIYQKFLDNETFETHQLFSKLWDIAPKDFEPNNINSDLAYAGKEITLLGIFHVDPNSELFELFDKVVFAIKDIIRRDNTTTQITSSQIQELVQGITPIQVFRVFSLLSGLGKFCNGVGMGENFHCNIGVNSEEIYRSYRTYQGLQNLINKKYSGVQDTKVDLEISKFEYKQLKIGKTKFKVSAKAKLKPVMDVAELANEFALIIDDLESDKGQMIGIFGRWGRGKSFFIDQVWNSLKGKTIKYSKVEFKAWKYQETPATWAYLYETLVNSYLEDTNLLTKQVRLLRLNIKRVGVWPMIKFVLAILTAIVPPLIYALKKTDLINFLILPVYITVFLLIAENFRKDFSNKAKNVVKKYLLKPNHSDVLGLQSEIQKEISVLLKTWIKEKNFNKKRIVLVVEDLDRCSESKIMQNLDALRLMLEDEAVCKRLIILTAIDDRILSNAIRIKYYNLFNANELKITGGDLIKEYFDKVFILAIKLGNLSPQYITEFITELVSEDLAPENSQIDIKEKPQNIETVSEVELQEVIEEVNSSNLNEPGFTEPININNHEKPEAQEILEKLTRDEFRILSSELQSQRYLNPRGIRILYYRFLLIKNILLEIYGPNHPNNIWLSIEGFQSLTRLVLYFNSSDGIEKLEKEKSNCETNTDEKFTCTFIKPAYSVDRTEMLKLFSVLETVVAY